ncbi:MAG TPA: hypothetical protein DDZ80_14615, partial [Cyanobacteria bacterium UBA8803]|nr:hypothetical protein [Cyanobacteria bacterium UBA8803]
GYVLHRQRKLRARNCGTKKETLSLSERVFHCDHCGLDIDRDLNASINLEKAVS